MFKLKLYGEVNDHNIELIPNKKYKVTYKDWDYDKNGLLIYGSLIKDLLYKTFDEDMMLFRDENNDNRVWIDFDDIEDIVEV